MLHSWSYYPSTLSCSLCLRLERTNTLLVLLVFSTNRAHALDLYLVSMSRYTSSKIWRSFTTPTLHQVKNIDLRAQTHWRYWTLRQSLPWDTWGRKLHQQIVLNKIKVGINRGLTTPRGDLGRPSSRSPSAWWTSQKHCATPGQASTQWPQSPITSCSEPCP